MEKNKVREYKCLLLEVKDNGWMTDTMFACPGLKFFALEPHEIGFETLQNTYQLHYCSNPDFIFISTNWYRWLISREDISVERVFEKLRKICDKIVGFEGYDTFSLGFPSDGFKYIDILLKGQGVYKDRELYNYKVGPLYSGANWTGKIQKIRKGYTEEQLQKIRLSFPCFVSIDRRIRKTVRKIRPGISPVVRILRNSGDFIFENYQHLNKLNKTPEKTLHFVGSMTHIQRMEWALELKKQDVNGVIGITNIPSYVWGTEFQDNKIPERSLESYRRLLQEKGLIINKMNRIKFKESMLIHKAVFAPCGYGELTFRMAEGWELGKAVICQDISHAETMYPFNNGENIVYCKPDFSDLKDKIKAIESNEIDFASIGVKGKNIWKQWIAQYDKVLVKGIVSHLENI